MNTNASQDTASEQPPLWVPSQEIIERTNLFRLMQELRVGTIDDLHGWSVQQPEAFWSETARVLGITFDAPYQRVLDLAEGPTRPKWFPGARMNIAGSCFSGPPQRVAILTRRWNGDDETFTVERLATLSRRAAAGFVAAGIRPGEGVAFVTMMTVEAIAAYLGVILAGAYAISIPESLPAEEISVRLRIGKAKLIVAQDKLMRAGKVHPLYERVSTASDLPAVVIPVDKESDTVVRKGDVLWQSFLGDPGRSDAVPCDPHDCINVLFSSGTTGEPKAIPWDHTIPIRAAGDAHWHHDLQAGDTVCWPTSLGWMMGPWLVFSGLLNRATIAIYEGAPVERGFCEFVANTKVTVLGLVPSIVRGWRDGRMPDGLDWSSIRLFSSSGEASDGSDYEYLMRLGGPPGETRPVIEYCGGTEVGGGYITSTLLAPNSPSVFNSKAMGTDFVVLDSSGLPCKAGEVGEVFLVPPTVGMSTRLLNRDNYEVYYAGCPQHEGRQLRRHGDLLLVLSDGRYKSLGRADDTMNLGGIKTSSAEIEQVTSGVHGVKAIAAVGVPPVGGGADRLVLFIVTDGSDIAELRPELQRAISKRLNPLFHIHEVVAIESIPRTASNKVLRRQLRNAYQAAENRGSQEPM